MAVEELVTGVQHIGLPTNDMEKTIAFYTGLGFRIAHEADDNGVRVVFLRQKNLTIETYENGQAVGRPGAVDHIALDVTDVDSAFKQVKAAGYDVVDPQVRFLPFWEKGVRFFNVKGPNAETIEFSQML